MEKPYLTTKVVLARPEARGGKLGYAIRYPDGYASWCPKEEFERVSREISLEEAHIVEGAFDQL